MTTNKDADTPKMTDPSTRKPTYADIVTPPIQHKTMLNQSTQQKSITLTQSPDSGLQTNKRRRSSSPVAMKSSTPIHSPESWIRPNKRRRSSGSLPSPVSVTLTNKYSNLSSMDNGDIAEFEFRSDNEISVDPPVTKKPKRKNDKIMKMDDSRIENYAFKSDSEKSVDSPIVKNKTKRNILLQMNISDASESISSEDNSCVKSGRVPVEGPHRGTLSNCKFLSTQQTLDLIAEAEDSLPEVPAGIKEDIFFIVNNTQIEQNYKTGKRREFWDDCGAWSKTTSPVTYLMAADGCAKFVTVVKKQGKFYIERSCKQYHLIEPQPSETDLIVVNRLYRKLKANTDYKNRITWISSAPDTHNYLRKNIAIIEYIGQFPGRQFHGNVKTQEAKRVYTRTKPGVKEQAKNMIRYATAKNVYDELNDNSDLLSVPRNLKQMQNLKYEMNRKNKRPTEDLYLKNLADHIINIENRVYQKDPFIRAVVHLHTGPSVLIYTDEQIQDIKRFCAVDSGSILGVDKTYNLGELHLTTTVFKNLSVRRTDTNQHPIFLGPSFLHGKSDFETFNAFFSHIGSKFTDEEIHKLIIGSDDETALRKSIRRSLPGSTQIICTRHLKNNVKDYLLRKVGVKDTDKKFIVNVLFGENGLTDADTTVIFESRLRSCNDLIEEKAPDFKKYCDQRIIPLIRDQVNIPMRAKALDKDWTNNNSESFNNLLKIGTNHKIEDMSNLIEIIRKIVISQYKDIEKAMVGMGNFILSDNFRHYSINLDIWGAKTKDERNKVMEKFYRDRGRNTNAVLSTNGQLTVPKTPGGGKKPHQAKRMAAERAQKRF
jgi:hypothetical protein